MLPFHISLAVAALLCSLVAGLLVAFASVVMPGLAKLDNRGFLRAFQEVDRIIQNRQPVFMLLWVGSIAALLLSLGLGVVQLEGAQRLLLVAAGLAYLLGVQLPTMTINIPLNNRLQQLEIGALDPAGLAEARRGFEPRWNRWNEVRTVVATLASASLILLVLRL